MTKKLHFPFFPWRLPPFFFPSSSIVPLNGAFPLLLPPLPPRVAIISPRCMKKKEENKGVGVDREGRGPEGGPGDVQWLKSTRFGDPTGAEFTI